MKFFLSSLIILGSLISSRVYGSDSLPRDFLNYIQEQDLDAKFNKLKNELNRLYDNQFYLGDGYIDDKIVSFSIRKNSITLFTRSISSVLKHSTDWQSEKTIFFDYTYIPANAYPIDITCHSGSLKNCLVTFSKEGSDQTIIVELDFLDEKFNPRGFYLPLGYNKAEYIGSDHPSIIYSHSIERSFANDYYIWSSKQKVKLLLKRPDEALTSSFKDLARNTGIYVSYSLKNGAYRDYYIDNNYDVYETPFSLYSKVNIPDIYKGCSPLFTKGDWLFCSQNFPAYHKHDNITEEVYEGSFIKVSKSLLRSQKSENLKLDVIVNQKKNEAFEEARVTHTGILFKTYNRLTAENTLYYLEENSNKPQKVKLPHKGIIQIWGTSKSYNTAIVTVENFFQQKEYFHLSFKLNSNNPEISLINIDHNKNADDFIKLNKRVVTEDGFELIYEVFGRKDTLNAGEAPAILTAYAYSYLDLKPEYSPETMIGWLNKGGIYVIAHPRGDGIYSGAFITSDNEIKNRQTTIDDFVLITQDIVNQGYADAQSLHADGSSAGGNLVVTSALQNPNLYQSVSAHAGCFNPEIVNDTCERYFKPIQSALMVGEKNSDYYSALNLNPIALGNDLNENRTVFLLSANKNDDRVFIQHSLNIQDQLVSSGYDVKTFYNVEGGHSVGISYDQIVHAQTLKYLFHSIYSKHKKQ